MSKEEIALRAVLCRQEQPHRAKRRAHHAKMAKKRADEARERAANEPLWRAQGIASRSRIFVSMRHNAVVAALAEQDVADFGCPHFVLEDQDPNRPLDSRSFRAPVAKIFPKLPPTTP